MKRSTRAAFFMAILLLGITLENPEAFHRPITRPLAPPQLSALVTTQNTWLHEAVEEEGMIMEDYGYLIGAESAIEPMYMAPTGYLTAQYDSRFALQAPVPEPETYAMMLTGAGLLGFKFRRKIQSS